MVASPDSHLSFCSSSRLSIPRRIRSSTASVRELNRLSNRKSSIFFNVSSGTVNVNRGFSVATVHHLNHIVCPSDENMQESINILVTSSPPVYNGNREPLVNRKEDKTLATDLQRLTITLTPEIVGQLDVVKKNLFWNASKADAIRYLIGLGLKTYAENGGKKA